MKTGENLAPPSICCCFCSADICAARGLFSICWLMNSRQLIRWLIEKLTAMLSIVISASGSTQLGFLTMSSKVFPGEKKTPITRANGLIEACASGAGTAVVAIEDGDGFIGNDELWLEDQGASNADALALASGEFVRIPRHGVFL